MPAGYSLVELMVVAGLIATATAVAVPQVLSSLDESRTRGAARYIAARFQRARMEAVMRSVHVGLKFTVVAGRYAYAAYVDGNGNGVRTADIGSGADPLLMPAERLRDNFGNVEFGTLPGLPAIDPGSAAPGADPIRLGASDIASFTPIGTSTSGTVYIRGERAQYAVRIFGDTAKTRVLKFDVRNGRWVPQ